MMKQYTSKQYGRRWMVSLVILLLSATVLQLQAIGQQEQNRSVLTSHLHDMRSFHDIHVSVQVEQASISQIFQILEKQMGFRFLYNKDVIDKTANRLDLDFHETLITEVLNEIMKHTGLTFRQINRIISVGVSGLREPEINVIEDEQQETISGTVIDAQTGETLPGVNILVKGTTTGTSTNMEGFYELNVLSMADTLVFSSIGYQSQEIPINNRSTIDVALTSLIIAGDELVVVGYGVQRRSDLTGSISSIGQQDISDVPVYSVENIIQGRAAGVVVSADGFRPGQGSTIRIRGTRSFVASNDPLLVLDGIPMENGFMDLNPRDIESIEILKDASATAIYGSRAANGVVLVTTRRGQEGVSVDYSGFTGFQYLKNPLDLMDSEAYAEMVREAHRREGTYTGNDEDIFAGYELRALAEGHTTDWQDLMFGRGFQQNHSLSIRGGGNGTLYSVSGTIDDHQSIVKNNDFRRLSGRINFDQQISTWLKLGVSSNIISSLRHQTDTKSDATVLQPMDIGFQKAIGGLPMSNPFDDDGNPRMFDELGDRNPLFDTRRENSLDRSDRTRVASTLFTEVDFFDNFRLRTNFSSDFTFRNDGFYSRDLISEAGTRNDRVSSLLFEAILNYSNMFRGVHRLDVTSLYSFQDFEHTITRLEVEGLPYESQLFYNLGSAERETHRSSGISDWKLESYMLRTNYAYDDRYLLTLTGRVDGSSRLAEGNKYGFFPSMAVAWHLGNESFMENVTFFSELKLRFSIGDVGNTAIQPYQTQGTLATLIYAFGDQSVIAFEHNDIPNPDLKWERTRSIDLGLDFAFMDDRISGSIDVYQSNTRDLLLERQLPATSGYLSTLENIGETRNRGIEFSISSRNIHRGDFLWSTDFNIASNRNEIVELFGGRTDDPGSGWFIGQPVNVNYYWDLIGIWQLHEAEEAALYGAVPGDHKFRDVNGDGNIGPDDRVFLGSPDPKWTAGITNRISYKGFDFSALIYAAQGMTTQTLYGSSFAFGLYSFRPGFVNNVNVDYWTPDNPSNKYPRPRNSGWVINEGHSFMDTSFIRVRNITLGYSLPPRWQSVFGTRHARIYASAQNPITFTSFKGYDPEGATGYDMPNYRTFLIGIELGF